MSTGSTHAKQENVKYFLVVVKTDKASTLQLGRRFQIQSTIIRLGNLPESDIPMGLAWPSPFLVEVSKKGESWYVYDVKNTGLLSVNKVSVRKFSVLDGCIIQVGEFAFEFSSSQGIKFAFFEENEKARQFDILTQAYNRGYLYSVLEWEIGRRKQKQPVSSSRRKKQDDTSLPAMSIVVLDIDHFGEFNKRYDHLVGDEVLREVVIRMKSRVRQTDVVSRWGGEEFVIYLPDTGREEAFEIAEKVRKQIGEHLFPVENVGHLAVTASIGVAQYETGMNVDEFVRLADHHMLAAKKNGRNRVVG